MENLKSKLIIVYGKGGTYKSTIAKLFLNNVDGCYINLEKELYDLNHITNCINQNKVTVIDYMDLINLTLDDIVKLKNMINNTDKTLVMVSCCACNKNLFNENYYKLKEISDLMVLTDK